MPGLARKYVSQHCEAVLTQKNSLAVRRAAASFLFPEDEKNSQRGQYRQSGY